MAVSPRRRSRATERHQRFGASLPRIRRDRHGRGLRGVLAPPDVPLSVGRAERFDEVVRDVLESVPATISPRIAQVEFAIEDVPLLEDWPHEWVPPARTFAQTGALPTRVVIYRRPIETRARSRVELRFLVADVVTEQIAELLAIPPEQVDPRYGRFYPG